MIWEVLGSFLLAKSITILGYKEVDIVEAMSFFEALSWLKVLELEDVIIEGDSKLVVEAIVSPCF